MHARGSVTHRWAAAAVLAAASLYMSTLVILAAWALVPAAFGWTPMAISSESMTPGISVGDIVVVDRYDGQDLATGTVVTFREGDRLLTHRIHEVTDDGYVTKGDANPRPDSTLVEADAIVGTGRVLVPALAHPLLWLQDGDHPPVAVWGLITVAAVVVVMTRPGTAASSVPRTQPTVPAPAVGSWTLPPGTVWHAPRTPSVWHRTRRSLRGAAVAVSLAALAAVLAGGAASNRVEVTAAALAGTTTTTGDWAAALAPPTNLQGTAGCHNNETDAHVDLSWTANTAADGYDVFRTTDPSTGYDQIGRVEGGTTEQYRDTTVVDGTYYYRLEATAGVFRSDPSGSVEVVVTATALPCL